MKKLRLALDWTANTNHSGFFVAKQKGFYNDVGISLEILSPLDDDYKKTPAKKIELNEADLALCPLESILSYNTKKQPFKAVAIATIFKEDVSAIVALKSIAINSPKDLDGKLYASYKARYEDEIVRQMIVNDGGKGALQISYPEKLGIWNTLINGNCDATWIFSNWEGLHAEAKGVDLISFKMADYGIPYGYSPVVMADLEKVKQEEAHYKNFLKATKEGFLHSQKEPEYAVECIQPYVALGDAAIDLLASQKYSNKYYGNEDNWGVMEEENVNLFLNWLYDKNLVEKQFFYQDLISENIL